MSTVYNALNLPEEGKISEWVWAIDWDHMYLCHNECNNHAGRAMQLDLDNMYNIVCTACGAICPKDQIDKIQGEIMMWKLHTTKM